MAAGGHQKRLHQQQPRAGLDQVSGERRKPPLNRPPFAAHVVDHVKVLFDQPGGPGHLSGGHRVPDRVIGQPTLRVPGCRVTVQTRGQARLFLLQSDPEQVGEQVVVAPPAADLIKRHQEQPGPLHLFQQLLAAGAAGHGVTQRTAEPLEHRGLQQERAHPLTLVLEHLFGEEVQDIAVAAGELCDEPGGIGLPEQ